MLSLLRSHLWLATLSLRTDHTGWFIRVVLLCVLQTAISGYASAQLRVEFSADTMRLGDIPACLGARDSFLLINSGTRTIPSPGLSTIPGFRVEAASDDNILPGEFRTMYVTFIGNTSVQSYASRYLLNVTIQGESSADTLWIFARRASGRCCVFRIDTIRGSAGDVASIRIRQDSTQQGAFLSDVTTTMNIVYDVTTLVPRGATPEMIDRKSGNFTVRLTLSDTNAVLAEIPAVLTLGSVAKSEARIAWHSNSDARVTDTTYSGPVELIGICVDKGVRLFDPSARPATITTSADGLHISVESISETRLQVFDIRGLLLSTLAQVGPFECEVPCGRGVYVIVVNGYPFSVMVP